VENAMILHQIGVLQLPHKIYTANIDTIKEFMKKLFSLLLAPLFLSTSFLLADATPLPTNSLTTLNQRPKIRLAVEADSSDISQYGLKVEQLEADINNKLLQANILIEATPQSPLLMLRMKAVETSGDVAAFVQLAFFEEASLSRNNNIFSAITWSQASLITVSKKDFAKEVVNTVNAMTSSFIVEYNKAFAK
jgi:hypothetical protein